MKLVIALLFASGLVVAAAVADSAELPSRNAPSPAAALKTCSVHGEPGVVPPGSDACVKVSGLVSAQVSVGPPAGQRSISGR